ncbi:DUF1501 domain-containing protein [Actinoplanes sp. NPDC051851]|uniref:DUF1501 domain-containing protein n=1 Tax=Actinoplanes sp. NPDC051851 TaxID=3154753 RepID=UPI003419F833
MDTVTRRKFLLASGVTGGAALAAGAGAMGLHALLSGGSDAPVLAADEGTLVIVTLYGGNDGLNTVVPFNDPAYHKARSAMAYEAGQVLALDETLGLNRVLKGMHQLWQNKQLAIVRGVGYPKPDRSHFRSMDIWQTASPEHPIGTGWIGRWLDGTKSPAETAVSFEPVLSPLLVGETTAGACVDVGGLRLPDGISPEMVSAFGQASTDEPDMQARVAGTYADLITVDGLIQEINKSATASPTETGTSVPATGTGGGDSLTAQFDLIARCIEASVPTRVYSVSLGGFDTHATERPAHERLLTQLDTALSAFLTRMTKTDAGKRVVCLVYSEFGRRVEANASGGTDHGTAGPVFLAGPGVVGGLYGEQPSLTDLDDGDLKATVDFRDIFGTILSRVLKSDPDQFLAGYRSTSLPFI